MTNVPSAWPWAGCTTMAASLFTTSMSSSSKITSSGMSCATTSEGFTTGQQISMMSPTRGSDEDLGSLPFTVTHPSASNRWISPREVSGNCSCR